MLTCLAVSDYVGGLDLARPHVVGVDSVEGARTTGQTSKLGPCVIHDSTLLISIQIKIKLYILISGKIAKYVFVNKKLLK